MLHDFLSLTVATIFSLLPISNPFSTAPIFLSLTKGYTQKEQQKVAWRTCIYVFCILVTFFLAGRVIMSFFGISIPGLRIAGGLMIIKFAMSMLNGPEKTTEVSDDSNSLQKDIAFIPLAMPSLSGPGTIAATIGLASKVEHYIEYPAVILGIFILSITSYFVLKSSHYIVKVLGEQGMNVLTNIMGFLILCIGVQFVLDGIIDVVLSLKS